MNAIEKQDGAGGDLQIQLTVQQPRFKAGAELPTTVNLELAFSETDGESIFSLTIGPGQPRSA